MFFLKKIVSLIFCYLLEFSLAFLRWKIYMREKKQWAAVRLDKTWHRFPISENKILWKIIGDFLYYIWSKSSKLQLKRNRIMCFFPLNFLRRVTISVKIYATGLPFLSHGHVSASLSNSEIPHWIHLMQKDLTTACLDWV